MPAGQGRRAAARSLGLGLGLVVALATACSGGDGGSASPSRPGTSDAGRSTTTAPTTTVAEDLPVGQPLVVVDQGFSTFPDVVDPRATLGGYGVVVQNPDPVLLATGVTVRSRILDAAGAVLFEDTALLNGVMPGARMAVGGTLLEPIVAPASIEVEVQAAAWLEPADVAGSLISGPVATEPEPGGGAVTRFTVRSSWSTDEEGVDVTALYRAADGRILAGEQGSVDLVPSGSEVTGELRLLTPIPDMTTTEVLVGRGFAAQTVG
ncbi:MAG: hypothetical protein AB7L84_00495 [Acidimicrobiia bacterium]